MRRSPMVVECSCRSSQAPRCSPTERRLESSEGCIDAPLTVMDCLVLHKLPREQREGKRGSTPVDRRIDVDGFQCGEQMLLLVIKRRQQRLPSQRADLMLVFSRPVHFSRYQRGSVDTAHTDDMAQLLAKRREAVADPMWYRCAPMLLGRIRRKVPFIVGDCTHKISGQSMEHLAVPHEIVDRHRMILAACANTGC
jgi:hypothetical protein